MFLPKKYHGDPRLTMRPLFIDQIHVVWKEGVECVHHLNWVVSSADVWAAFWFFVIVGPPFSFEAVIPPDWRV